MLSLALVGFVGLFFALGLKRPFVWVLAYIYIDVVAPQRIAWSILPSIPISLIVFLAAFGGWLMIDDKRDSRFTLRQGLMALLLLWCGYTTLTADFPEAAAEKWAWVWKALVFAIFLPLTLRTRLRFEATTLVMVLSIAALIITGGLKTAAGGGGYGSLRLLVQDDSGLNEGSIISCVAVAIIPLILWLTNHGTVFPKDWRVKLFAAALIFACLLIPVGTQARTGLVCIGVLAIIFLRATKHRFLYAGLMGLAAMAAIPFMPSSFTERMSTIENHQADQSASTRIAVWKWTWEYVQDHPGGGGFAMYLANNIRFETTATSTAGNTTEVESTVMEDKGRAFHSSYFELLGEQGWPGFLLWIWLQGLGIWQMERIRRRYRHREGPGEQWQAPFATALQQAQIVYLVGSFFVGIAFQPFIYMLVGLQCGLWSYLNRLESDRTLAARRRQRPVLRVNPQVTG